jgi:hypothetical protein
MKSFWAAILKLLYDVSETVSVSIIRGLCDGCYVCILLTELFSVPAWMGRLWNVVHQLHIDVADCTRRLFAYCCCESFKSCMKLCGLVLLLLWKREDNLRSSISCDIINRCGEDSSIMKTCIDWQITGEETNYEFKRSWLLPVLRENVCSSQIKFFLSYFLPLATVCR